MRLMTLELTNGSNGGCLRNISRSIRLFTMMDSASTNKFLGSSLTCGSLRKSFPFCATAGSRSASVNLWRLSFNLRSLETTTFPFSIPKPLDFHCITRSPTTQTTANTKGTTCLLFNFIVASVLSVTSQHQTFLSSPPPASADSRRRLRRRPPPHFVLGHSLRQPPHRCIAVKRPATPFGPLARVERDYGFGASSFHNSWNVFLASGGKSRVSVHGLPNRFIIAGLSSLRAMALPKL